MHDILKNVKQQIDPLADAGDEPGEIDRDIAAILSGSDFQAILEESLREADDMPGTVPAKPAADQPAAPAAGSASAPAGQERPSPFGTVLNSLKHKHAAPAGDGANAAQSQAEADTDTDTDTWDGYSFLLDDGPDPGGADIPLEPALRRPRRWWGSTRQILYMLLLLLVCLFLFRLFRPREKEYVFEDFFQPGNPDIEFLDAVNFLEKYYDRHPELKHAKSAQEQEPAENPAGPERMLRPATESGESGSSPDDSAVRGNASATGSAEPAP